MITLFLTLLLHFTSSLSTSSHSKKKLKITLCLLVHPVEYRRWQTLFLIMKWKKLFSISFPLRLTRKSAVWNGNRSINGGISSMEGGGSLSEHLYLNRNILISVSPYQSFPFALCFLFKIFCSIDNIISPFVARAAAVTMCLWSK